MEASCESEILELELNSKLENSRLEIDDASSADISVGLVSVSDDQSKCEESKVDTTVVEGEQDSSIKFDVKNLVEEEANQISTLAQGKKICHDLLFVDIVRIQMRRIWIAQAFEYLIHVWYSNSNTAPVFEPPFENRTVRLSAIWMVVWIIYN